MTLFFFFLSTPAQSFLPSVALLHSLLFTIKNDQRSPSCELNVRTKSQSTFVSIHFTRYRNFHRHKTHLDIFFFLIQTRVTRLGPNDSPTCYFNNNHVWNLRIKMMSYTWGSICTDLAQQVFVAAWIWQIFSDENTCTCAPSCYNVPTRRRTHAHTPQF